MRLLILMTVLLSTINTIVHAQGCVAIRGAGGVCTRTDAPVSEKGWQLNTSYRYFRSFRHFVGKEEQKHRVQEHTEVVNLQHFLNFTLIHQLNSRWSVAADIPVTANRRSSLYEHGGNSGGASARHTTASSGIGDLRLSAYRWLLDPQKAHNGNIQAGLGLKIPTGNFRYKDVFVKGDGARLLGPVDQSIQPGDGGWGITAELNAHKRISKTFAAYLNGFYLVNPREENGVSTSRGGTPSQNSLDFGFSTMSVPDQYMARTGMALHAGRVMASAGLRIEGIPASDLIGGDAGFRRPGYVFSFEPGFSYAFRRFAFFASVPVALERNRTQSYSDRLRSKATNTHVQGDAAFADYAINLGASIKL